MYMYFLPHVHVHACSTFTLMQVYGCTNITKLYTSAKIIFYMYAYMYMILYMYIIWHVHVHVSVYIWQVHALYKWNPSACYP